MKAKVLVVEDDDLTRFLMGEMCRMLGLDCEIAADGQHCLDMLESGAVDFDLILMDIQMPRVSGLEATKAIRSNPKALIRTTPIVAVTAESHWHEPKHYEPLGFDSALPKPVELAGLTSIVRQYVGDSGQSAPQLQAAAGS
ncbi:response regulator [Pelagibius litoralis]|uniref:Response regulator n=1 Tax=Pelagibius litoralis TaxID=374515 RepID=A0A967F2H0_9PROT|nr:response regulator [Pelagibius litoralis]NIA71934.1 response regulator [Pelagibius litoralis]